MKVLIFLSLLFCCNIGFSQEDVHPVLKPGRTLRPGQPKSYADSEDFAKLFKEFYPMVKPEKTVKDQADQYFQNISRSFKMQGIDSGEAAKAAFKNLDDKAFEKIYFDTYRRYLSAKELKKYMAFLETSEGKHIAEVWSNLQRVSSESQMYVAKTLNLNLTPIRQAARDKMEKEHPPKKVDQDRPPLKPRTVPKDVFNGNSAGSTDSLMYLQKQQNKIPPVKIPVDPSQGK